MNAPFFEQTSVRLVGRAAAAALCCLKVHGGTQRAGEGQPKPIISNWLKKAIWFHFIYTKLRSHLLGPRPPSPLVPGGPARPMPRQKDILNILNSGTALGCGATVQTQAGRTPVHGDVRSCIRAQETQIVTDPRADTAKPKVKPTAEGAGSYVGRKGGSSAGTWWPWRQP